MGGGSTISLPKVTVTKVPKSHDIGNTAQKILIVAQMLATGTAESGKLATDIGNAGEENALFGARSIIAGMIRKIREDNKKTRIDAIPLADAVSGTAAVATLTLSGTATAAGTLSVTLASRKKHRYVLDIVTGATAAEVASELVAAITADQYAPFTASASSGVVTVTAANKGSVANAFPVEIVSTAAGLTAVMTARFTGGATDPSLSGVLDIVGDERYQTITVPYELDIDPVQAWLDARWNDEREIRDGVLITATSDTFANLKTLANAKNSQSLVIIGDKEESSASYKGAAMCEAAHYKAAFLAAVRALRLTPSADISDYIVAADAPKDQIGGDHIRSLPYANTPALSLSVPDIDKGWTADEIEELNTVGITVIGANRTRINALLGHVVTTYKTDGAGNPDTTWHPLNAVDQASGAAEYLWNNLKAKLAQSRLTDGALSSGHSIHNAASIRALMLDLYDDLSGDDYLLVSAGQEARDAFNKGMDVALDLYAGSARVTNEMNMVSQLRSIYVVSQFGYAA